MGATLAELVPKLKTHVSGLVDWSYLSHANCVLLECRRVLSNAYIFAFYMFDAESFLEVCILRSHTCSDMALATPRRTGMSKIEKSSA